jgi:hypothetical protein
MYGYPLARPEPPWFLEGASGIVTTGADLAQWLIVQNNGGLAVNGTRIISAEKIAEMHRGLGWSSSSAGGVSATEHGGWLFTFTAHQMLLPESGYGIAVLSNVGLGLAPVDSQEIAQALAEMTTAKTPNRPARTAWIVDSVLAALTVLTVAFGVRSVLRAPEWGARRTGRPVWRSILALLRSLLPLAVLLSLPALLSVVFGGRDASWLQLLYLAPALVIWLVAASFVRLAVMVARAVEMRRRLVTDEY